MPEKDFISTLHKLKTRGYFIVDVYPNTINEERITPVIKCKEVLKDSAIQLRGWDYPHIPTVTLDHQNIYVAGSKVEAWIDWEQYKEVLQLHKSGHFLHLFGLFEDWFEEDSWNSGNDIYSKIKPGTVLLIINMVYRITEVFVYLRNLVNTGLYDDGITVKLTLNNTKNRVLKVIEPSRAPLFMDYRCMQDSIEFPEKTYSKDEVLNNYLDIALENIVYLCNQFNWDAPPINVLKEDQKKLLERRI
jgi:hypothetical protein